MELISRYLQRAFAIYWEKFFWLVIVILLALLPLATLAVAFGAHEVEHKVIVDNKISVTNRAFEDEMRGALQKTELAAQDALIRTAIISNDASSVITKLNFLAQTHGLSTMVAVGEAGTVIARVPSSRSGDMVFLTTPWGQNAAQGKESVLVGPGRNYPLIVNSAVPIIQNGSVQGALFGGYILNDAYAVAFKNHHLRPYEEVAFYSVETGVYGTSFQDPATARLFKLLFNESSDAIQKPDAGQIAGHFKIGDTTFHVSNIKLTGSGGQVVGGMFMLTPAHTNIPPFAGMLFGLAIALLLAMHVRKRHRDKRYYVPVATVALFLVVISTLVSVKKIADLHYDATIPDQIIYNSTMEFSPQSDIFVGMGEQRIGIKITTGGEAINAAQASISFDPQQIRIEDIIMDHSFCEQQFVIEKTIDNKNGRAAVTCGKSGGYLADTAILAELLIQPLRAGEVTLTFDSDTQVLANDGLGTNVLRTATNGSYQIIAHPRLNTEDGAVLFSYSHPNPGRWYNERTIHISWILPAGYEDAAYVLDQKPDTTPDGTTKSAANSKDLFVQSDGIYYFHLAPLKSGEVGPVSHLKLMIDATPPKPASIRASATEIDAGDIVRFEFSDHSDAESGLQKNFYVQFDGGIWLPTGSHLNIPFFEVGINKISLRVFDNAGNYSDANIEIVVE